MGMTRAELTAKVKSLHSVGGLYEIVALIVEADNAPYVVDDETSTLDVTPIGAR